MPSPIEIGLARHAREVAFLADPANAEAAARLRTLIQSVQIRHAAVLTAAALGASVGCVCVTAFRTALAGLVEADVQARYEAQVAFATIVHGEDAALVTAVGPAFRMLATARTFDEACAVWQKTLAALGRAPHDCTTETAPDAPPRFLN